MSHEAKEAGIAALISGILGGKRAEEQASRPHPLTEPAPPALTSVPATAPPAREMPPTFQEPVTAAAPPAQPAAPRSVGRPDEKRARLPAVAIGDLVLGELRKMDGFPSSGVSITVYGSRPWNAMIRFAPFSTTARDAARLRHALPDIVFRLRQYVDIQA
ncbi:hypothetical protein CWO91_39430 [Bradyrhizobium genosp. SA-3]|uniref:hypothetical protein n=1 Tax=Bradyrhizobium genosp. SA-3 TaxID=508868 RepID=UPI00102A4EB1|nr:hypothetical protein [Bradyrhizobium genosp. SA-3]RZM94432.1 hypothetical protein CWO91_39430 [Bradyrhizobium genosp. SA-3]